jgi:hypothetical protein
LEVSGTSLLRQRRGRERRGESNCRSSHELAPRRHHMVFRFHKSLLKDYRTTAKDGWQLKAFIKLGHASSGVKRAANIEKQRWKSRLQAIRVNRSGGTTCKRKRLPVFRPHDPVL